MRHASRLKPIGLHVLKGRHVASRLSTDEPMTIIKAGANPAKSKKRLKRALKGKEPIKPNGYNKTNDYRGIATDNR